jgi:hypothetical protein
MASLYHLVNYLANDFSTMPWTTFIPPASWRDESGDFYKNEAQCEIVFSIIIPLIIIN